MSIERIEELPDDIVEEDTTPKLWVIKQSRKRKVKDPKLVRIQLPVLRTGDCQLFAWYLKSSDPLKANWNPTISLKCYNSECRIFWGVVMGAPGTDINQIVQRAPASIQTVRNVICAYPDNPDINSK